MPVDVRGPTEKERERVQKIGLLIQGMVELILDQDVEGDAALVAHTLVWVAGDMLSNMTAPEDRGQLVQHLQDHLYAAAMRGQEAGNGKRPRSTES